MIKTISTATLALAITSIFVHAEDISNLNGQELMARYTANQTVDTELAFLELKTFEIDTPAKEIIKKRFIAVTSKKDGGGYDYLIRMVKPEDVEGVSVLTNVDAEAGITQYLYLPARGKPMQLGSGAASGNFLGSDFAYEDLVREAPGEYEYTRLPDGMAQGETCAVIQAKPAEGNESQYTVRNIFLDPKSFEVRKIEFYGDDLDDPVKELQAYEYRSPDIDGTTVRPRFAVMTNLETGTISVFKVLKSRLNLPVKEELFTVDNLTKMTPADINGLLVEVDQLGN